MEDEEKEKAEKRKQYREASEKIAEDDQSAEAQSNESEDIDSVGETGQTIYDEPEATPDVTESIIDRFDNSTEDVVSVPGLPEAPEEEPKKTAPKRRSRFTQVMA